MQGYFPTDFWLQSVKNKILCMFPGFTDTLHSLFLSCKPIVSILLKRAREHIFWAFRDKQSLSQLSNTKTVVQKQPKTITSRHSCVPIKLYFQETSGYIWTIGHSLLNHALNDYFISSPLSPNFQQLYFYLSWSSYLLFHWNNTKQVKEKFQNLP